MNGQYARKDVAFGGWTLGELIGEGGCGHAKVLEARSDDSDRVCKAAKRIHIIAAALAAALLAAVVFFVSCNFCGIPADLPAGDPAEDAAEDAAGDDIAFSSVSFGNSHIALLDADGGLWIWGGGEDGRFADDGTGTLMIFPEKAMDDVSYAHASGTKTMAVMADGSLWALAEGSFTGGAAADGVSAPEKIMDDVSFVRDYHGLNTMAIKTDGSLWAWGGNALGQIGDGTTDDRDAPVKVMDDVLGVTFSNERAAAVTSDNGLWIWGWDNSSHLGFFGDSTAFLSSPLRIMDEVVSVSQSPSYVAHTLAIKTDGSLWAWGNNGRRQIDGTSSGIMFEPVRIMDDVSFAFAGMDYSVAISSDGSLWAWGDGVHEILGTADYDDSGAPMRLMDDVSGAFASYDSIWAIKSDGSLWVWGGGFSAAGANEETAFPIRIMIPLQ